RRRIPRLSGWRASDAGRASSRRPARPGDTAMIIKICGITNLPDAQAAIASGANALGFNFYPRSKRYVGIGDAAKLAAELPPTLLRVGVFVNEPADRVAELVKRIGLHVAQLHGDETPEQYPAGTRVWKAARADENFSFDAWE